MTEPNGWVRRSAWLITHERTILTYIQVLLSLHMYIHIIKASQSESSSLKSYGLLKDNLLLTRSPVNSLSHSPQVNNCRNGLWKMEADVWNMVVITPGICTALLHLVIRVRTHFILFMSSDTIDKQFYYFSDVCFQIRLRPFFCPSDPHKSLPVGLSSASAYRVFLSQFSIQSVGGGCFCLGWGGDWRRRGGDGGGKVGLLAGD